MDNLGGASTPIYLNAWGLGAKGQLGTANSQPKSISAVKIPNLPDGTGYFEISCGENHTLILTEQLDILSCGSNTYG